jgi:hypothetical protein
MESDPVNLMPAPDRICTRETPARGHKYWLSAAALTCMAVASHAAAPTVASSVIAGGGGSSTSPGKCFKLHATAGQHSAAHSSGGVFAIDAGFLPGRSDYDPIFHHGFEVCS